MASRDGAGPRLEAEPNLSLLREAQEISASAPASTSKVTIPLLADDPSAAAVAPPGAAVAVNA